MRVTVTRKRVKNFIIRVADDENIFVTAPLKMSNFLIQELINKKHDWIEKKLKEKSLVKDRNINFFNHTTLLLGGSNFDVTIGDVPNICCIDNKIIVPTKKASTEDEIKRELNKYLVQLAKTTLPKFVAFWGCKMSLCPTAIKVKQLKSKWGSCNGDGEIVLNSKLVQLPKELCDYVVVHELCHLQNLNHSAAFWKSVENNLPDYLQLRANLKEYDFLTTL